MSDITKQIKDANQRVELAESKLRAALLESELQRVTSPLAESLHANYHQILNNILGPNFYQRQAIGQPGDRRGGKDWPLFQTETELGYLRAESEYRCNINPHAKGLLNSCQDYVVGTGPVFSAATKKNLPFQDADANTPGKQIPESILRLQDKVQAIVDDFVKRDGYKHKCGEAYKRCLRDGEAFIRMFLPQDRVVTRFVEPDRVRNPMGGTEEEGWTFGIRHWIDPYSGAPDINTPVEYNVISDGAITYKEIEERVPAERIVHIKKRGTDSNIKRGIPEFVFQTGEALDRAQILQRNSSTGTAIREAIAFIKQYENATQSSVLASIGGNARLGSSSSEYNGFSAEQLRQDTEPGQVIGLPKGTEFKAPPTSSGTSTAMQVLDGDYRAATAGFQAPGYFLGATGSDNFASTKEHGAPFIRRAEADQEYYAEWFLKPVHFQIQASIDAGELPENVLDYIDIQCDLPNIIQRDPLQQSQRNQLLLQAKVMSPQQWCREEGYEPDEVIAEWAQWQKDMGPLEQQGMPGGEPGGEQGQEDLLGSLLGDANDPQQVDADSVQAIPESFGGLLEAVQVIERMEKGFQKDIQTLLEDWVRDPGPRSKNRWTDTETGRHTYTTPGSLAQKMPGSTSPKEKHSLYKRAIQIAVSSSPAAIAAKHVAKQAGFSESTSEVLSVLAAIGDWSAPGIPAGSALVIIGALVRKPSVAITVTKDMVKKAKRMAAEASLRISGAFQESAQEDVLIQVGEWLESVSDMSWGVTAFAAAMEESGGDLAQALQIAQAIVGDTSES